MKKNENLQIWIFKEKQEVERETRTGRFVLAYQKKDCKKQPIIKYPYIYLYLSLLAENFCGIPGITLNLLFGGKLKGFAPLYSSVSICYLEWFISK